jgi:hypothetical protein
MLISPINPRQSKPWLQHERRAAALHADLNNAIGFSTSLITLPLADGPDMGFAQASLPA